MTAELVPNTKEWLEQRKKYMGASDAPAALGLSSYRSPSDVWASKQDSYVNPEQTPQQARGHILEGAVALAWSQLAMVDLLPSRHVVHPDEPFMACTPDRFRSDDETPVQIKTHAAWVSVDYGASGSDVYPQHEFIQVAHELACTNAEYGTLVVLLAEEQTLQLLATMLKSGSITEEVAANYIRQMDLRIYPIERDYDFEVMLIEAERDFWEQYVAAGVVPPDITKAKDSGDVRPATDDEAELLQAAKDCWIYTERQKRHLESMKGQLQDAIGEDSGIIDQNTKDKVTWKKSADSKSTVTDWAALAQRFREETGMMDDEWDAFVLEFTETKVKPGSRRFLWPTAKWKKEL
jgi:putative phage-type endonuclease